MNDANTVKEVLEAQLESIRKDIKHNRESIVKLEKTQEDVQNLQVSIVTIENTISNLEDQNKKLINSVNEIKNSIESIKLSYTKIEEIENNTKFRNKNTERLNIIYWVAGTTATVLIGTFITLILKVL